MKKMPKTNAMRQLDSQKIDYCVHEYPHHGQEAVDGNEVAQLLGIDPACVFKTLVTRSHTHEILVYMIPVNTRLDLKKCAKAAQVKNTEMVPVKEIQSLTGYIRGGCSPLGMKKKYRTFIDQSALKQNHIVFSGGKIGIQIEMDPRALIDVFHVAPFDLVFD